MVVARHHGLGLKVSNKSKCQTLDVFTFNVNGRGGFRRRGWWLNTTRKWNRLIDLGLNFAYRLSRLPAESCVLVTKVFLPLGCMILPNVRDNLSFTLEPSFWLPIDCKMSTTKIPKSDQTYQNDQSSWKSNIKCPSVIRRILWISWVLIIIIFIIWLVAKLYVWSDETVIVSVVYFLRLSVCVRLNVVRIFQ